MTNTLLRLGALMVGLSAPICVWAVSAQPFASDTAATRTQIMTQRLEASQGASQIENTILVTDQAGQERRIPAEWLSEEASAETATRCCWVYYFGTWWCIPCS